LVSGVRKGSVNECASSAMMSILYLI